MPTITVNVGDNISDKASTAVPGDVIELAPGWHTNQQVYIGLASGCVSGTAGNEITIRSQDSDNQAILSSNNPSPWHFDGNRNAFVIEDVSYWNVENFQLQNFNDAGFCLQALNADVSNVTVDGITIKNSTNVQLYKSHHRVGVHQFIICVNPFSSWATLSDCTVKNCLLENLESGTWEKYNEVFTVFGRVEDITIENNTIKNSAWGIGFNLLGSGNHDFSNDGRDWWAARPQRVTFKRNKVLGMKKSKYAGTGFYYDKGGDDHIWEENFVEGCRTFLLVSHEPWYSDGNTKGSGLTIRNNVGVIGQRAEYGSGYVWAMMFGSNRLADLVPVVDDIHIHNNVFIVKNPDNGNGDAYMLYGQRATNVLIENNIFYEQTQANNFFFVSYATQDDMGNSYTSYPSSAPDDSTWVIQNNAYGSAVRDAATAGGFNWPSVSYKAGLTAWKAAGRDAGSVVLIPAFPNINGTSVEDFIITNDPGGAGGRVGIDLNPSAAVANAGTDQTVYDTDAGGDESVTLDGSESYSNDGTITAWVWTCTGVSITNIEEPTATFPTGTHTVTLEVTDSNANTDTDTVTITVITPSAGGDNQELQAAAATDMGYANSVSSAFNSGVYADDLYIGDTSSGNNDNTAWIRWQLTDNIGISDVIQSVVISVYGTDRYTSSNVIVDADFEDATTPATPTTKADLDGRTYIAADSNSITWPSYSTPGWLDLDVTDGFDALVTSQSGFTSGDYVAIRIADSSSGWGGSPTTGKVTGYGTPSNAPKITITIASATPGGTGPILKRPFSGTFGRGFRTGFST